MLGPGDGTERRLADEPGHLVSIVWVLTVVALAGLQYAYWTGWSLAVPVGVTGFGLLATWALLGRRLLLVALGLAILVPLRISVDGGVIRSVSVGDIVLVIGAFVVIVASLVGPAVPYAPRPRFWKFGCLYFALSVSSLLWSISAGATLRAAVILGIGLCAYEVVRWCLRTEADCLFAIRVFLLLSVLAASIAWFNVVFRPEWLQIYEITDVDDLRSWQIRLGSPLWGASNYFASLLLFAVPSAFSCSVVHRTPLYRSFWLCIAFGLIVTCVATLSVGGALGLVVGLVVNLLDLGRTDDRVLRVRWLKIAMAAIVVTVSVAEIIRVSGLDESLAYISDKLEEFPYDEGTQSRLQPIANVALPLIAEKPVLGYGSGVTSAYLNENWYNTWVRSGFVVSTWHNVFVQALHELGVVGAAVMFGFWMSMWPIVQRLTAWGKAAVASSPTSRGFAIASKATFASVLSELLFQQNWDGSIFQWLLWLYLGIVAAQRDIFLRA